MPVCKYDMSTHTYTQIYIRTYIYIYIYVPEHTFSFRKEDPSTITCRAYLLGCEVLPHYEYI